MQSLLYVFLLAFVVNKTYCKFDYTCKFVLSEDEVIDLTPLSRSNPPDYVYHTDDVFFIFNFCKPTIKHCNGIEGSFASIWNATTYSCIGPIGGSSPILSYIDPSRKYKGIKLIYNGGGIHTIVEVSCDHEYPHNALVNVEVQKMDTQVNYVFHFKSNAVCMNDAKSTESEWNGLSIFLILLLIFVLTYLGCDAYMNRYNGSFSQPTQKKEFVLNLTLKGKEMVNKIIGQIDTISKEKTNSCSQYSNI